MNFTTGNLLIILTISVLFTALVMGVLMVIIKAALVFSIVGTTVGIGKIAYDNGWA